MKRVFHPTAMSLVLFFLPIFNLSFCLDTSAARGTVPAKGTSVQTSGRTLRDPSIFAGIKTALTPGVFFISDIGGTQAIWTTPPSGGPQELLLSYGDLLIVSVNVSTTRDEIAFITHELSDDYFTGKLWLAEIDGSNVSEIPVTTVTPHQPAAWSADGQVIVFPTLTEGLYKINRDGTNLQPLTPPETSHHWDDDPDVSVNNDVVYNNMVFGEIRVAPLAGAAGSLIKSVTGWTAPQWSPDGERILYNELDIGLRIMNRDGTNDQLLLAEQSGEDLYSADWSPLGILYVRVDENTGNHDVWVIDPDGTNKQQLTSGPAIEQRPQWVYRETESAVRNWLLFD